jgi:hypothetical protein
MAQSQSLELKIKGLYTSPNNLGSVPPGALSDADNVVIDRDSIVESRRGQTQYGTALSVVDGEINKLFNYKTNLLVSYYNKLAYDSDGEGTWVAYSGTYLPPSDGFKIRSLEAQGNFYFTTTQGIKKIDALTSTPRESGVPVGLGGSGSLSGVSGFLADDTAVAYRIVWGYRDANNNLILGAPSQRLVVSNDSGNSADVALNFPIPSSITTEYFYQIYRSPASATAADEPSDELQLVIEDNPTSGEIAVRNFSVTDVTPYSLMGATIYTAPSQQGIAKANNQPPYAVDMDIFKNCAFYANTRQKQSLNLTLISVDLPSFGYLAFTGTVTGGTTLTIADTTGLRVGMGWPIGGGSTTYIQSIDSSTVVTLTAAVSNGAASGEFGDVVRIGSVRFIGQSTNVQSNCFVVETSGSPEFNIEQTALNLVRAVNLYLYDPINDTAIYGFYVSTIDDLPGKMLFTERSIGGDEFAATSTAGSSFSPVLPTSGTDVVSENDTHQNRVYISKPNQVEAVPLLSYLDVGSANFPILRVVALRDGIFFFKTDGIYRISGEVDAFNVSLVDNTVILKASESAVPFNNQVFCCTTQGVCAVTDSGVQIMSVPIENILLEISSEQFTNFSTATFGVAYESSRQYMLWTITEEDDEFATQAFVYNSLTNTWTRWIANRTCGIVNPAVNKLFMGKGDSGQVMIERKSYTNADYADEQYAINIVSIDSDDTLTVTSSANIQVGMALGIYPEVSEVTEINGNVITVLDSTKLETGGAYVYQPIDNFIRWVPIDVDNPGLLKQFGEVTFFFRNAAFREIDAYFASNASQSSEIATLESTSGGPWGGFPWGDEPWGGVPSGQIALRTYVPRDKQRCNWLNLGLRTNEAFTGFSLAGVSLIYNVMSSRFR